MQSVNGDLRRFNQVLFIVIDNILKYREKLRAKSSINKSSMLSIRLIYLSKKQLI